MIVRRVPRGKSGDRLHVEDILLVDIESDIASVLSAALWVSLVENKRLAAYL